MLLTLADFKKRIEFSLVPHFLNEDEIRKSCSSAISAGVGVICVNPNYVKLAKSLIGANKINLSANIGFPWGTHATEFKVLEAKKAADEGADQIDMVLNVGFLRSKKYDDVYNDIRGVVNAAQNCFIKVIIETWVLDKEEKIKACKIVENAGAHCVKTTSGVKTQYISKFTGKSDIKGAEIEDMILFRKILSPTMKIKASGGVYGLDDAFKMLRAGADQLGVSRGVELIKEFEQKYKAGIEI